MTQPGWFPDPAGRPGMFRYWNGVAWTEQVTEAPGGVPGPSGGRRVRMIALVSGLAAVLALLLLAWFVLPGLFGAGERPAPSRSAPPGAPTRSAWDETSRPTPSPTPTPTPTPTKSPELSLPCPRFDKAVVNGRLYGGGLSVPVIEDRRWSVNAVRSVPWAICATGLQRRIAAAWVSEVILAGVQPGSMLDTLEEQADAIAADSLERFYIGESAEYRETSSKAVSVGGLKAWELRYQVRIDYLTNIPGDHVYLLVVQHADGSRSVLMTFATIGDEETRTQVDRASGGLKVEKR